MRAAGTILLLGLGADLVGPLKYEKTGVVAEGKRWAWKDVASITETDSAKAREDYQALAGQAENLAALQALVRDPLSKEVLGRVKPVLDRRPPSTALRPPFQGRWKAAVDATRHHQLKGFALFAIDFLRVDEQGKLFGGTGKDLEDYLGFDQEVRAAADGEVVQAEAGFEDLAPGRIGKAEQANVVMLRHSDDEFTLYAHLKKGSVLVKAGDRVKTGQLVGRVGNSGASGTPHLHFTMLTPIGSDAGGRGWVSVPWRLHGFTLVDAGGTPCSVEVKQARLQEGWVLLCPKT